MPQCAFKYCKNNYRNRNVSNGVSYFRFPANPIHRAKWISIVSNERREKFFRPRQNSVVCSIHFDESDIVGNSQRRRLLKRAIPKLQVGNLHTDVESLASDQDDDLEDSGQRLGGSATKSGRKRSRHDFKSYSDAESMISDNEEVTIEATSSGGRPYITIDGSTVSTGRKRPRPTAAGLSKKYKATSTQDDVDVMKLMVVDDITEPSKPVKRRVDVLLKMCRTMFREKDHEISILREQVEELTKKNVRLRNALIDMKKTATIEDTEIPEETPTSGKKSKDVKKAKVKQCKHKGDEVKVATVGTIPEPTRVKKEPVDVKIDNNIEIPRIGDEINTRSNVIEEIGQEMDPLIIKTEPVYDNERPVAVTELNYCDTEDVVAFMAGPISIEETAPDIVGLETHDVVIGDGDSESLWSTIKQEVD
ncbi:uncharacterized protein LOC113510111 isoform X2 [Galleria mellonella]|uniref:Uncharacterized protein LOC113510111 isoform X2 n=1 Tax=Galleria mellonella TaxID=7137 RepID=A0ABM3MU81_GALME|nr:uncharacterized protein LOC113510111 isoform X2 [Galleria mellonella]